MVYVEAPIEEQEIRTALPLLKKSSKLTARVRQAYDHCRMSSIYHFLPQPGVLQVSEGIYTFWFKTVGNYAWGLPPAIARQKGLNPNVIKSGKDFYRFEPEEANSLGEYLKRNSLDLEMARQLYKKRLDLSTLPEFKDLAKMPVNDFWESSHTKMDDYEYKFDLLKDSGSKGAHAGFTRDNMLGLALISEVNKKIYDKLQGKVLGFMTQQGLFYYPIGDGAWMVRFKAPNGDYIGRMLPFTDMPETVVKELFDRLLAANGKDNFNYHMLQKFYESLYPVSRYFKR